MNWLDKIKSWCMRPKKEVKADQPKPAAEASKETTPEALKKEGGA